MKAQHTKGLLVQDELMIYSSPPAIECDIRVADFTPADGDDELYSNEEAEANAARAVMCWNMHDELAEALRRLVDDVESYGLCHPEEPGRFEPETATHASSVLAKLDLEREQELRRRPHEVRGSAASNACCGGAA